MKWLLFTAIIIFFASCVKENNAPDLPANAAASISFPQRSQGPFGVIEEGIPENNRIIAEKALGVNYVRADVILQNFTQPDTYIDSLLKNNFKIAANFNYYGNGSTEPFPTNLTDVTNSINNVLKVFHPAAVAVENEEANINYHRGPAQDYINELNTATNILHENNIKVMNGGLTEAPLCVLVYRNYLNSGFTAQAADFAKRTMPQVIIDDLPALTNTPDLAERVNFTQTLLNAYKNMNFDYINFHWYEPVLARWGAADQSNDNVSQVNTGAISEVINYLHDSTGKPVVTNETGELNSSPGIVQNMLQQYVSSNLPYVIWYSGDGVAIGKMAKAVALNNADGTLRSNGDAFRNFLQNNYSNF